MWKNTVEPDRPQTTIQDVACGLNAEYVSLKTHSVCTVYLLFFHGNNGHANAPQCYIIRELPGFFTKSAFTSFVEFSE